MGNKGDALVIMTNKDTYHVSLEDAKNITAAMIQPEKFSSAFETTDAKTGAEITVTIASVSSVVIPAKGGQNA